MADSYDSFRFQPPIPGQSLTGELGSKPWEKPPRVNTPDEALEFYMERLTQPTNAKRLFATLEAGLPVDLIVQVLVFNGFMEGVHTINTGLLVSGPLAGFITLIAKDQGIEVKTRGKKLDVDLVKLKKRLKEMNDPLADSIVEGEDEDEAMEHKSMGKGLMGKPMSDAEEDELEGEEDD